MKDNCTIDDLLELSNQFLIDLECLREMHALVDPVLAEKDLERRKLVNDIIRKSVVDENGESWTAKNESKDNEDKPGSEIKIQISIGDAEMLVSTMNKAKRAEILFGRQLIVTVVSRFDEFIGKFLSLVLKQNPSWIVSSEKTITYKELISLNSIDRAIDGFIQKEVDSLLRGSHKEQIDFIDQKLKSGISENCDCLLEFIEIAERRNLFVHTGGQISKDYMENCNKYGIDTGDLKIGDELKADKEYFNRSFYVYFEVALRIAQATYRRLFPEHLVKADRALNNLQIKFMNEGEFSLAELIAEFDIAIPEKLRSSDTEYYYYSVVNRAICQKALGKDFEPGLKHIHWNVFHPKYALCLHSLRDEFDHAANLMLSKEVSDAIGVEGFRTWPVFKEFRGTSEFRNSYKAVFGNDYIPDLEKDAQLKSEQVTRDSSKSNQPTPNLNPTIDK